MFKNISSQKLKMSNAISVEQFLILIYLSWLPYCMPQLQCCHLHTSHFCKHLTIEIIFLTAIDNSTASLLPDRTKIFLIILIVITKFFDGSFWFDILNSLLLRILDFNPLKQQAVPPLMSTMLQFCNKISKEGDENRNYKSRDMKVKRLSIKLNLCVQQFNVDVKNVSTV